MKFELFVTTECNSKNNGEKNVVVYVGIPAGTFVVDFTEGTAKLLSKTKLKDVAMAIAEGTIIPNVLEYEFDDQDLKPKEGFPGVKSYKGATVKLHDGIAWRKLLIEYLDTTGGSIPMHKHNPGEKEVYISADFPFEGRFCNLGESHEPFAEHTIAVKLR